MTVGKGKRGGPTFSCKGFISCSFLIAFLHTYSFILFVHGTICWHIGRLISNTSNIFRIFTDSFLFIKCIEAICHPLLHQRGVPTAGWGSFFALFSFLLFSFFLLVFFFFLLARFFLLVFFFSVFIFFTGSGLSSSLFKLICRSSFLKWAWLPIFSICPRFPLNQ